MGELPSKFRINENPKGWDACGLEGIKNRPLDCPNNPDRYPHNHRPGICRQCFGNSKIWQAALEPLSPVYIKLKQQGVGLKRPKNQ